MARGLGAVDTDLESCSSFQNLSYDVYGIRAEKRSTRECNNCDKSDRILENWNSIQGLLAEFQITVRFLIKVGCSWIQMQKAMHQSVATLWVDAG